MEMSQQLVQVSKFIPHKDLVTLADMIRDLRSFQITGSFTTNQQNHRCVLGALAVEFLGARDNHISIVRTLNSTWINKFKPDKGYICKSDNHNNDNSNNSDTHSLDLFGKIVVMNDGGRTFNEIANWLEIEAYRLGEYYEAPQPKVL